jgi:hypothetical protein
MKRKIKAIFLVNKENSGFTLVELLFFVGIFVMIYIAVSAMGTNIFIFNSTTSGSYQATQNSQAILKVILKELREASPGANGAYPLVNTGSTTLSFFSDVDNDGVTEQITYTLIGTNLYRAVIKATGSPPSYLVANQSTTTLITNVVNGNSIPSFLYFDTYYTGTSTPLAQPVNPSAVKLIQVNQRIDIDPNRSPLPIIFSVQANIRNLKTNL